MTTGHELRQRKEIDIIIAPLQVWAYQVYAKNIKKTFLTLVRHESTSYILVNIYQLWIIFQQNKGKSFNKIKKSNGISIKINNINRITNKLDNNLDGCAWIATKTEH